jgi:membrane protein DedA with SNARE-associated domain
MTELMAQLAAWIQQVIEAAGYLGIAFVMALENIFTPIPSEFVLPFAGFSIVQGKLDFVLTIVSATIGVVIGGLFWYVLAYKGGMPVAHAVVDRWGKWIGIDRAQLDKAVEWFGRRGDLIVFLGRLVPIFRTLVSIPAGAAKMPMPRYLALTIAGSVLWNVVLTIGGMVLGENWENVLNFVRPYESLVTITLGVAVAGYVLIRIVRIVQARRTA